jgi:hypothetical protein
VYAPHGESSGHITFRVDDMAAVGAAHLRRLRDAALAERFFGVAPEHQLPAILATRAPGRPTSPTSSPSRCSTRCRSCSRASSPPPNATGARSSTTPSRATTTTSTRGCSPCSCASSSCSTPRTAAAPHRAPVYAEHLSARALRAAPARPRGVARLHGAALRRVAAAGGAVSRGLPRREHGELVMPAAARRALRPASASPSSKGGDPSGARPSSTRQRRARAGADRRRRDRVPGARRSCCSSRGSGCRTAPSTSSRSAPSTRPSWATTSCASRAPRCA